MSSGDGEQARKAERTTDDLIREMIEERDAAYRQAEEARARLERLEAAYRLDQNAREWRKATGGRGLQ